MWHANKVYENPKKNANNESIASGLIFLFKKKHWNRLSCQMEMPLNENSLRFAQKQIHYIPFAIAYACHSECFKNCNYISELLLLLNALRIESIKV